MRGVKWRTSFRAPSPMPSTATAARLAVLTAWLLFTTAAQAQAWPARPVRLIVPFTAGGSADTLGRLVAQKLAESLKQSFIVENRPGAGGVIGSELVVKAAPDGYTLLVSGVASHCIAPALARNFPFDPLRDFTHIALFGGPPGVLVVHPGLPVRTLPGLIALARSQPGRLAYGSPGNGTQGHLIAELLKQAAGIDIAHVPYRGASPAMADLIAGHVRVASTTLSTASAQIHAGKARALAVSSGVRVPDFPEVPTFAELGYTELVVSIWFSLSGPAAMPADIVRQLNTEVRRALQFADVRSRLLPEGIEPGDLDPQSFTAFVAAEVKRWAPIVRASGAQAD